MDDLEQDMSPEDLMLSFVSAERGKVTTRLATSPPLSSCLRLRNM